MGGIKAFCHRKLGISLGEVEAVGGKRKKARSLNGSSFPLEVFQEDGERWRQLGGKNLSILFMFYQSWESGWRRSWRA